MAYNKMVESTYGLSEAQIKYAVPSAFAATPWHQVSDSYNFVPTTKIMTAMRDSGYAITLAMQSPSRIAGKAAFTKHALRFRKTEFLGRSYPDVPELIYVGSHDRASKAQVMAGIFRTICSNGLIAGDFSDTLTAIHRGQDDLVAGILVFMLWAANTAQEKLEQYQQWKQVMLSPEQEYSIAQFASTARWGSKLTVIDGKPVQTNKINPYTLLIPRYHQDRDKHDLYHIFNTVQKNIVDGGIHMNGWDKPRARRLQSVDAVTKINTGLWAFTEELAKTL